MGRIPTDATATANDYPQREKTYRELGSEQCSDRRAGSGNQPGRALLAGAAWLTPWPDLVNCRRSHCSTKPPRGTRRTYPDARTPGRAGITTGRVGAHTTTGGRRLRATTAGRLRSARHTPESTPRTLVAAGHRRTIYCAGRRSAQRRAGGVSSLLQPTSHRCSGCAPGPGFTDC